MFLQRMLVIVLCGCVASTSGFCENGISDMDLYHDENVIVTWAQCPLFSTVPEINQTGKYLNLFHTALIFHQDGQGKSARWWTLEFDSHDGVMRSLVPEIIDDDDGNTELIWKSDARWCLTEGILHNRSHWTTNFEDVAIITSAQFEHLMYDWLLDYNATVPGAWPQYNFFHINDPLGNTLFDDITCGHAYWLLTYVQDSLGVAPLVDLSMLKATRIVLHAATLIPLTLDHDATYKAMVAWYRGLSAAVATAPDLQAQLLMIFELFLPMPFWYNAHLRQYYSVILAEPDALSVFDIRFEALGTLPGPPEPPTDICDVSSTCAETMAEDCEQEDVRGCRSCFLGKLSSLVAGGCPGDLVDLNGAITCYCRGGCGVSSKCFDEMNKVCHAGGGLSCRTCLTLHIPQLLLFGFCSPVEHAAAQNCFCEGEGDSTQVALIA